MKKNYTYWIKERHNPQLGVYYVPMGQMSRTAALAHESSLYGENFMMRFETKEDYDGKLAQLKAANEKIH